MRHTTIDPELFSSNRRRLTELLLERSLVVVNANDILPTNGDGTMAMHPNADLFYLTGIEQEESILLLASHAFNEKDREILFVREHSELLKTWEGHKLSKEEAKKISGIANVKWLSEFQQVFHQFACEAGHIYLNSNEHPRASIAVETRDARFAQDCRRRYPLHDYQRLAPLMSRFRSIKSRAEIALIQRAIAITKNGFERVCQFVKPGVNEAEVEAEFAHEFIRNRAAFSYLPIIASGSNACVLHYIENDKRCSKGDLLLLDVGARYANYVADVTRTIPVSGRFTKRQRDVYNAVCRVLRASIAGAVSGKLHRDWQKESQRAMNEELLELGLLKPKDIKKQTEETPACRKYFMHGLGHPLGIDVHDLAVASEPFAPGLILTVEPGIYIPEEGFGVRLENDILVTDKAPIDLTSEIPLDPGDIESLMNRRSS